MINKNTPDKLAGIVRDTWPQLFWLKKDLKDKKHDNFNTKSTNKGVV
jgi:hypothetical protein